MEGIVKSDRKRAGKIAAYGLRRFPQTCSARNVAILSLVSARFFRLSMNFFNSFLVKYVEIRGMSVVPFGLPDPGRGPPFGIRIIDYFPKSCFEPWRIKLSAFW